MGSIKPDVNGLEGKIPYTKEGIFLLAKQEKEEGPLFIPIYVLDKDTVFALGMKFIRSKDQKDIEDASK
jgi:hypothetical protein